VTLAEDFTRNLFMARRRAGLTQAQLAERSGLSIDAVHKLERGRRSPLLPTIAVLAEALEVEPGELIEGPRR
jgi:transcriptional regulator with XRE-family HTH domain